MWPITRKVSVNTERPRNDRHGGINRQRHWKGVTNMLHINEYREERNGRIFKKTQIELLEIKYIYNTWSENFTGWDKHCRKKEISELEDTAIKSSQNEVQREKDDC